MPHCPPAASASRPAKTQSAPTYESSPTPSTAKYSRDYSVATPDTSSSSPRPHGPAQPPPNQTAESAPPTPYPQSPAHPECCRSHPRAAPSHPPRAPAEPPAPSQRPPD